MTDETNNGVPPVPPVPPAPPVPPVPPADGAAPDAAAPDSAVPPIPAAPTGAPVTPAPPVAPNPYATAPAAPVAPGPYSPGPAAAGTYSPGPAAPAPYQPYAPARPGAGALAIVALVLGIIAFLLGLIPFVGGVFALGGLVVGFLAVRKPAGRGLSITGLILSGIGLLANLAFIGLFIWAAFQSPTPIDDGGLGDDEGFSEEAPEDTGAFELQTVDTPCFSVDGPATYINNISAEDTALCAAKLELWGEYDENGEFVNTGVGAIYGSVYVEPIRVETAKSWGTDGTVDGAVDYLETNYFPEFGIAESLRDPVQLDGEPANLSRFDSKVEETQTRAAIVAYSPAPYTTGSGDVQFFLVTVSTIEDNGDAIIDAVLDSWEWK